MLMNPIVVVDVLPSIVELLAVIQDIAVTYPAMLTLRDIFASFKNQIRRLRQPRHTIRPLQVTICERLENGDYVVHQGLFDTISASICDVQKYLVKEIDAELTELHEKKLVVLYG